MTRVTYTYWRHFSRYSEQEESLVAALKRAEHDEDYNDASVESITLASGEVLATDEISRYYRRHKELEGRGWERERKHLIYLRYETTRIITWKEASTIIRRMRWKPSIATSRGISYLVANMWGKEKPIVSVKQLRGMTPAQFWERLRKLDPYRVAEVERNIF